jgi:cell division protein FtsB
LVGLALVILLVGVVTYRVASGEALARADALRAELLSIQETNARLARQNEQLSRDVAALRSPESLVQVARDNLGMARPGEVIYFVAP